MTTSDPNLAEFLKSFSPEELQKMNESTLQKTEAEYQDFLKHFRSGLCHVCGKPLASFSKNSPCLHWLLKPKGFKKRDFPLIYGSFNYAQISSFARWMASTVSSIANVNDLVEEHSGNKFIDFTARYRHITWSFSCGNSDFEGHQKSAVYNFPHYHLQMRISDRPFINYSDFHIPFTQQDYEQLKYIRDNPGTIRATYYPAPGMQEILDDEGSLDAIIEHTTPVERVEDSAFHLQTFVQANNGERISGELMAAAVEEAKREKKTLASVLKRKFSNAEVSHIISPSEGFVKAMPRAPRKKN